jgi:hypothetical protein
MLDMIHYKKFPFTELQGKLQCSEKPSGIPVMNQTHPIQTSQSCNINTEFCSIFKSIWGSIHSTMNRIYAGRSGVQILSRARELSLLHNIHTSSSAHPASLQCRQSDHSHPSRAKFKNQWSYTSTQPVSLYGTYWYNFILPLPPTYVHISQEVTSFLVL